MNTRSSEHNSSLGLLYVAEQQLAEQEVTNVVGSDSLFEALCRKAGLTPSSCLYTSITGQAVNGSVAHVLHKAANTGQVVEIE